MLSLRTQPQASLAPTWSVATGLCRVAGGRQSLRGGYRHLDTTPVFAARLALGSSMNPEVAR